MSTKPTFVLIPGNFLPAPYYDATAKLLGSRSFPTRLINLPSTGSTVPLQSNEPDVNAIRKVLDKLLEEGKEVVVVAHSYASVPASEALKGLALEERRESGESGGITKFILVAAWLLSEGENPPAVLRRHHPDSSWVRFDGGNIYCEDSLSTLFTDTSPRVTAYWKTQVTHSDIAAFVTPLKYAAWRDISSVYLLCENDTCLPTSIQEDMVGLASGKVKVVRMPSGHMPMLSMPEEFVKFLLKEAGENV